MKPKHILVATDLSKRSRIALRRAVLLAAQSGWQLSLLHVVDDDRPAALIEHEVQSAESTLREDLDQAGGGAIATAANALVVVGDPFRAIVDEATRLAVDLIVMGSHRKRLLRDIFTGTTIERVMRLSGRPVLMVNRDSDASYANVLAAVDLSEASLNALRTAADLGLLDPQRDAAIHAFLPLEEGLMYYAGIERAKIDQQLAITARQARAAVTQFLRKGGFEPMVSRVTVRKGVPVEAIEAGVHKLDPDLLVIGTRGHGGVKRVLLGSVADGLLRRLSCDILAVPPG